ncbi:hypothetical protein ACW4TU_41065 [Streptomyces sp. QTS52]
MSSFHLDEREKAKQFASYFKEIEDRLAALERSNQLNSASIEGGSLDIYDDEGVLKGSVGVQPDGAVALVPVNTIPPPTPSPPTVASVLAGLVIGWDGLWDDSSETPTDFALVQVHVGNTADFTPGLATQVATITAQLGGTATVHVSGYDVVWVRLVAQNTAALTGQPSTTVQGQPRQAVEQDLVDGMVTEVKLAQNAVTAAKLALGAVGTTALAEGAVLEEKLAKAAVTLGKIANGAVNTAALATDAVTAGKVAADAISARELQANSVTALELAAGSVTANAVAAGAITTDKLTVTGGSNILPDPSFEGAVTAALILGLSYATQDKTKGNGSASSLKVDSRSATAVYRDVPLTLIPALPGDQFYLAADCFVSADWVGTSVNMHARWEDAAGVILGYGVVGTTGAPVPDAWSRVSGTVTAPAGTVRAAIRMQVVLATAGDAWFDNAAVRPVVPGVQIADGAITAPKILAGAVTTDKLIALGVTAEKIASLAITTDKLNALAVTADKLAVNSVTATKIAAGAVEATHIKAGAITADKLDANAINGKTITGATVQTAASGPRIVMNSSSFIGYGTGGNKIGIEPNHAYPFIYWTSDDGTNKAVVNVTGGAADANLGLNSGTFVDSADSATYKWRTYFGNDFWVAERLNASTSVQHGGRLFLGKSTAILSAGPSGNMTLTGDAGIRAAGVLRADNISVGVVTITPVANTPTSVTLSGGAIKGTNFRGFLTANTAAPGTQVLGVGCSSVSSSGMTIWLTRTNAAATNIYWMIIGED